LASRKKKKKKKKKNRTGAIRVDIVPLQVGETHFFRETIFGSNYIKNPRRVTIIIHLFDDVRLKIVDGTIKGNP
jgi:hypothetical protein